MIKDFIKYFKESKEYRKEQLFSIALSIICSVISAIVPFVIRSIIKDIQTWNYSRTTLFNFALLFFVIIIIRVVSFFYNNLHSKIRSIIGHEKRLFILSNILEAKIYRKKNIDDSTIIDRLMREIYCYSQLLGTFPITILDNIIRIIVAIIVLLHINIYLFFFSIFLIPIGMLLVNITKDKMEKAWENQISQWEDTTKLLKEIFASRVVIKQMNSENQIMVHFKEQNMKHFLSETHINKINFLTVEIHGFLSSSLPMFCLLTGFLLVFFGKSDIGSAIAFYMYVNFLLTPFSSFADVKINNIQAHEQEKRIQEILKTLEFDNSELFTGFNFSNISIKKISYQYSNGEKVFFDKHINFLKPGLYFVSTVSGFGKSTIFKLMSKILFSDDTSIAYDSFNVNHIPEKELFKKVTYLDGSPVFIQGTIIDNITSFGKYKFDSSLLNIFFDNGENINFSKEINIGIGKSLSSGQLQRINLLRMIAKGDDQKLIILDEAISGIEEERECKILDFLKTKFNQSIIILVTHRKSSELLCDFNIEMD